MASRYTYLCCDLVTNQVLAELPFTEVAFSTKLDDVGDFRGKLKVTDPNIAKLLPKTNSLPSRTALYVDRDGVLIWGGIIWTRRYKASDGFAEFQGQTFESYFDHRYLTATKTFAQQDQLAIVEQLMNWMQAVGGGNIGIVVPSTTSPQLVTAQWNGYELKGIGDAIRELSQADAGFDYAVDVAYVAGVPTKTLTLSYPRRGATFTNSGWVFEYSAAPTPVGPLISGNLYDYEWPEDGTLQGITVHDIGSGSGALQAQSSFTTQSLIDAGYPLLEQVYSHHDVIDQVRLAALAAGEAKMAAAPIAMTLLYARPEKDPVLGSYTVGDDCRVRILDYWHNNGLDPQGNPIAPGIDQFWRIIEIQVNAGFDQPDSVELTLGVPPA